MLEDEILNDKRDNPINNRIIPREEIDVLIPLARHKPRHTDRGRSGRCLARLKSLTR